MNRPSDRGADPNAAARSREEPRQPLYGRVNHWLTRVTTVLATALYAVMVVSIVASLFTADSMGWAFIVWLVMAFGFPFILAPYLRMYALYGSARGLEIARWGTRRTVPWSKVGDVEFAWWSLALPARVTRLTLHEDDERTILFFANDRIISDLERMRFAHADH